MNDLAFAGIDVAFARRKALPICVVQWCEGRLEPLDIRTTNLSRIPRGGGNPASLIPATVESFANAVVALLDHLAEELNVTIERVAIDAPSAPCAEGLERRLAEREMDRLGYSCIPTPTAARFDEIRAKCLAHLARGGAVARLPHANQLWMLVGFALFSALGSSRSVLEVFPHAIIRSIGVASTHKTTPEGYAAQLAATARVTGWSAPGELEIALRRCAFGARHDRLDAFLSAWIAALPLERLRPCGVYPEDVIWIPRGD